MGPGGVLFYKFRYNLHICTYFYISESILKFLKLKSSPKKKKSSKSRNNPGNMGFRIYTYAKFG